MLSFDEKDFSDKDKIIEYINKINFKRRMVMSKMCGRSVVTMESLDEKIVYIMDISLTEAVEGLKTHTTRIYLIHPTTWAQIKELKEKLCDSSATVESTDAAWNFAVLRSGSKIVDLT